MAEGRVPYPPRWWRARTFDEVKRTALDMASSANTLPSIARMLASLEDCEYLDGKQDHEGATYKSIAYAGRLYGLAREERQEWIDAVGMLGLAQRHTGHIIARAPKPEQQVAGFRVGEEVRHKRFGVGRVVEVRGSVLYVEFDCGIRSFVPEYTPTGEVGN